MKETRMSTQNMSLKHENYFELKVTEATGISSLLSSNLQDINFHSCPPPLYTRKDKSESMETTLDPNSLEIYQRNLCNKFH